MRFIQRLGIFFFLLGLITFTAIPFLGEYQFSEDQLAALVKDLHREKMITILHPMIDKDYTSSFAFVGELNHLMDEYNSVLKAENKWDEVIWDDYSFPLAKAALSSPVQENPYLFLFLSIGLVILGGLLYILPQFRNEPPGIKNNGVFHSKMKNRGWLGMVTGTYLILFYVILYWYPAYLVNLVWMVEPISLALSGNPASQWFLYGLIYTLAILVMGVRMFRKYRGNRYQQVRTASLMFFQTAFAFLIPEILVLLNKPYFDFKNIWPLDYSFFYDYRIESLTQSGAIGMFMLIWGILLIVVGVPAFTYFYGKRWYCSWVCGCGGLAETVGDPYRQLSDKSLKSWKIERYLIHSVLALAVVMTVLTIANYFTAFGLLGNVTNQLHSFYGFFIGSAFAGVVGTGFYPFMGNRVWCRFGCPLAAYLGLVQRFKSRFRITTNGGQCISCGNCSTYCEMGIDVRWYAQRGQNIVRSSCVGCGVCAAVCPRGVLKLENGPEEGRINEMPLIIGNDSIKVNA
ncbi:MAG: 4Fe-4S binding protein [Cyclobacteriaceae bacterium]|nr:4Fe-4S binding protein [Cyclobacteriaceae bacterium]